MSMISRSYTKLFTSIITSSLWDEDSDTRVVWVTMMALADQYSEVHASIPGLARVAKVPRDACERALKHFMSPDPDSRTKTDEGRRIVEIDGGWKLLNGQKYRELMSAEERREYKRLHEKERRAMIKKRGQGVDKRAKTWTNVTHLKAEAEVDKATKLIAPDANTESNPPPAHGQSDKDDKVYRRLKGLKGEVADRFEAVLNGQWTNDAGKWVERIKVDASKCERVVAEVESAVKEGRIDTTPAQYAEHIWKEFR